MFINSVHNSFSCNHSDGVVMSNGKAKSTEKDKEQSPTASITMADISSLLDKHRAAHLGDFKSSFESLASTLDSIRSTITDHGKRINSLETNAISIDQRLQHLKGRSNWK